jgi:hypothetical protein
MQVTIWKNDKESSERAITRFNKKVQASRKLLKIREERFHVKKPKGIYVRNAAVMRDHYRAKREKSRFY